MLFEQLIRAALPGATERQVSVARIVYNEQLTAIAGDPSPDAMFTADQAVAALRIALDRLE